MRVALASMASSIDVVLMARTILVLCHLPSRWSLWWLTIVDGGHRSGSRWEVRGQRQDGNLGRTTILRFDGTSIGMGTIRDPVARRRSARVATGRRRRGDLGPRR